jgi:hypothetical protein
MPFKTDQLAELVIGQFRDLLRRVELRIALHDALFPGYLVQILVVEHAHDEAMVGPALPIMLKPRRNLTVSPDQYG